MFCACSVFNGQLLENMSFSESSSSSASIERDGGAKAPKGAPHFSMAEENFQHEEELLR